MYKTTLFKDREITLSYNQIGSGKPLFFFPGAGANTAYYTSVLARLSKTYTVIAINWPGFDGASAIGKNLTIMDYADYTYTVINSFNVPAVNVLAHSMGGGVLLQTFARCPDLINKLILPTPVLEQFIMDKVTTIKHTLANHTQGKAIAPNAYISDIQAARDTIRNLIPSLQELTMLQTRFCVPLLPDYRGKVQLYVGKLDTILPYDRQVKHLKDMKGLEVITYDDAGHDCMFTKQNEVVRKITEFLA